MHALNALHNKCLILKVSTMTNSRHGNINEMRRIATPFTDGELYQIDDWGFARRMRDRSQMVRELVFLGLEASEKKKGEVSAS